MLIDTKSKKAKQVSVPEIHVLQVPSALQSRKSNQNRIPIFTTSNSRNSFNKVIKSKNSGNLGNLFPILKKRSIIRNYDFSEEINMKEIYKEKEEDESIPKIIQKFLEVNDCSILKYGLKPSIENVEFSFCRTCDPNLINPICMACINTCHKSHEIKKKFIKGEIKCICGERLHCISKTPDLEVNNNSCQLGEWYIISKLNFYYKTKDNKCLCMLCYNFCNKNKSKNKEKNIVKLNPNEEKPICCCKNEEIHQEKKIFFEKMDDIACAMNTYEYFNLLHPSQIINMIFLSKNQFEQNYADIVNLRNMFLKNNFMETSEFNSFKKLDFSNTIGCFIFSHLLNFIKWNKYSDITYFCDEAKNFFSFDMVKLVVSVMEIMRHNEKSFWVLSYQFLKLFNKIYIGNLAQSFAKFKLPDLENFSVCLRWSTSHLNSLNFPESQEIINHLISWLTKINIMGFTKLEVFSTLEIIITIFKKLAKYNLISNTDMTKIVLEIDKTLLETKNLGKILSKSEQQYINKISNERRLSLKNKIKIASQKEFKLYYIIIKLLYNFNLCFNDRIIHNILLNNNSSYQNLESINNSTVIFSFVKSELGRALVKLTIRVLYTLQTEHFEFYREKKYKKTMNYGMKLLKCFLLPNDSYMLSIIQSIKNIDYYEKINNIEINTDTEYQLILAQKGVLENAYYKYFNFEMDFTGVINQVKASLNKVLETALFEENNNEEEKKIISLADKRLLCILKTKYYFSLSKFFRIFEAYESQMKNMPKDLDKKKLSDEYEEELISLSKRINTFYKAFIYQSCDNSFLVLSFYIFNDLCKAPIHHGLINFELFYDSVINICNTYTTLSSVINYILNLYEYLEKLRSNDYNKINECLYIFMNILEILILNIKSLDLEDNINKMKDLLIYININYKIIKTFYDNKANLKEDAKFDKCLLSFIKLINNVFDFTNEANKNDAINILNPEKAIYAIKYYNINLDLRTEFLKYIRKINIDLSYNKNSNNMYTNSIISIEDNLVLLKTNPLITNFRYPTRLLSYFKDFVNLSAKSEYQEQAGKSFSESDITSDLNSKALSFNFRHKDINKETIRYNKMNINMQVKEEQSNLENDTEEKRPSSSDEESESSEKEINEKEENGEATNENGKEPSHSNTDKKILKPVFDNDTYDVILNELLNLKDITGDVKVYEEEEMESLRNYFENGLLLTIIYFLKKAFVFAHCFSGKEMLKIYELIIQSCNLRLHIAEYKHNFWDDISDINSDTKPENFSSDVDNTQLINYVIEKENFCKVYNNRGYLINGDFCINTNTNEITEKALNTLQKRKFLCFDFTTLYNIFEKNLLSLLKDRKDNNYGDFFNDEEKIISLKTIEIEEEELFPTYKYLNEKQKKVVRLYMIYSLCKKHSTNENNSSLFSILPELCLEYETNFRYLLISYLVNNGIKSEMLDNKLNLAFPLLYKLLNLQTGETQATLINIIGGNDTDSSDLGFMDEFSQYLFKKIILLFIESFNAPDQLFDVNYVFSFLLIKIFKFLCEEHNNFFQCRLIKTLDYKYTQSIPMYYHEVSIEEEDNDKKKEEKSKSISSENDDNLISQAKLKSIKFFDFFLHVILKIMLISEWSKLDNIEENIIQHKQNTYLYDIFAAIIEMLNEIIQGSRPEFLNRLGNSVINSESNDLEEVLIGKDLSNHKAGFEYRILEKVDSFQYFIKTVTEFIFSERNTLELLYKIKNELMQFFITILEEKNCNEEIQKFIIKYLNINRVFSTISSILKNYYVMELPNDTKDKYRKNNATNRTDTNDSVIVNYAKTLFSTSDFGRYNTLSVDRGVKTENDGKKMLMNNGYFRAYVVEKNKFIFNEKLLDYYRDCYYYENFNESQEFQLSNIFYKYIKLIAVLDKSDEAKNLIEQAEILREESARRKFGNAYNNELKEKKNKISKNVQFTDMILKKKYSSLLFQKKQSQEKSLNESEIMNLNNSNKDNRNRIVEREKTLGNIKTISVRKTEAKLNSLINESINEVEKDVIEHYYIIKFFESITKTIEIRTEEALNQTVIFTQPPEMIYLSNGTKSEFEREVNRDSETSKKNDLVTHITYFIKEINYYQNKQSSLAQWISRIDFFYVQIACYIYFLFFNLFILFTLKGDTNLSPSNEGEIIDPVQIRRVNDTHIRTLINNSLSNYNHIYNFICYLGVAINGFLIMVWTYFRLPLYFKVDKLKYMKINNIQKEEHITFFQNIYIIIFMTILDRGYILTLVFEFIVSLIAAFLKRGEIIYAFLLLPIIDLNKLIKNIIVSVKLFYSEVSLTFFFMAIIIYIFSNFAFFFFNEDYEKEIEYQDDNLCKTLVFCFLNAMDSGLRARGGIGDSGKRISFLKRKSHYLKRIIMDDFFFILIVITAIDLVFGIIIRAFANLRDMEQKHENDRKNHCFICHVNKNSLEKNRQNFEEHRNKIHFIWNYVDYMITLKFSDIHDLNAINSYASEKLVNKDISWLPTYKDLETKGKNGDNNEFEEELKVEDENVNKYFVKTC